MLTSVTLSHAINTHGREVTLSNKNCQGSGYAETVVDSVGHHMKCVLWLSRKGCLHNNPLARRMRLSSDTGSPIPKATHNHVGVTSMLSTPLGGGKANEDTHQSNGQSCHPALTRPTLHGVFAYSRLESEFTYLFSKYQLNSDM